MPQSPVPTTIISPKPAGWFRRRVLDPLVALLRQGLAPEQLALTVALAVGLGIVPLLGATTVLALLVAWQLRLNVAAMQLVCHLLTPVQLLLLLPLLRLGAQLFGGASPQDMTIASLRQLISHDWRGALSLLWRAELGALGIWLLGSAVLVTLLYFVLKPIFRRVAARTAASEA